MLTDFDQNTPCVTVVDDEPLTQDVLVRAAVSWQYRCQSARCAEEALVLLEQAPTPIVVTDLRMPGKGGVWLVKQIRRRWPDIGIIVLTASPETDAAQECLKVGAHHFFLKPIKLEEFQHVLQQAWRTFLVQKEESTYRQTLEKAVRKQTRRVRQTFLSGVKSLVRTMEERDRYTAGHSLRVSHFALQLAEAIGLDQKMKRRLRLAARLHDIGKVGVPEAVLNKNGRLTDQEMKIVQSHPTTGERILQPIIRQKDVLAGIRGHHERWDGFGYPDGLCQEEIPLLARLITIPDFFDAVTSDRAYRSALSLEEALHLIRDGAGTHFDPQLVQAFLQIAPKLPLSKSVVSQ